MSVRGRSTQEHFEHTSTTQTNEVKDMHTFIRTVSLRQLLASDCVSAIGQTTGKTVHRPERISVVSYNLLASIAIYH